MTDRSCTDYNDVYYSNAGLHSTLICCVFFFSKPARQ